MPRAAWIARSYGHPYKNGAMVGKNILALAIRQLHGFKDDEKFADFLWETGIAQVLGYKRKPHFSLFSKTRRYVERGAIETLYHELAKEKCKGRLLRLLGEDSTEMPAFYTKKDTDAQLGHRTKKRREQQLDEMTGRSNGRKESACPKCGEKVDGNRLPEKKEYVFGYKLHLVNDLETGLPLAAKVKTAEVHDSQPFYDLFPYVIDNYEIQEEAKFCADSAYDSADIRQIVRNHRNMKDVIAVNGRGHYPSETPKDKDYGKRWRLEQTNSVAEGVYGLASSRAKGLLRNVVLAFSCLIANFMEYFMD